MPSIKKLDHIYEQFQAGETLNAVEILKENPLWDVLDDLEGEIENLEAVMDIIEMLPVERPAPFYLRRQMFAHMEQISRHFVHLWNAAHR